MSSNAKMPAHWMWFPFALLCGQALAACDAPLEPAQTGNVTYIHGTITQSVGDGVGQDEWVNLTTMLGSFTSPNRSDTSLIEVTQVGGDWLMDCLRVGEGTLTIFTTEWKTYAVNCVHNQGTGS